MNKPITLKTAVLVVIALAVLYAGVAAFVNRDLLAHVAKNSVSVSEVTDAFRTADVGVHQWIILVFFICFIGAACLSGGAADNDDEPSLRWQEDEALQPQEDISWHRWDDDHYPRVNPATGLTMCGGLDVAGNAYGSSD